MKYLARSFLLAAAATVTLSAQNLIQGPSSSQTSYLTPTSSGWSATSLLTVGDAIGGYLMIGIPDGLGAFSNGNGTMTVLANHEIGNDFTTGVLKGTARAHGIGGGTVSKWVINTSTWQVISGGDFLTSATNQMMWDSATNTWAARTASTPYAYLRPCAADLPNLAAFYDASNGGTGYNGRIFMNGEETGAEGKAFAWIVDGAEAGKVYELPHHGKYSYENLLARSNYGVSPGAANLLQTVVVGTDDTTPGEVYVYIGAKTNLGNAVQKAGLANGLTYGLKVLTATGYTGDILFENATGINGTFGLVQIFDNATLANKTGAQFQTESLRLKVTQFARPEDSQWLDHDSLIFAVTGATVNSVLVSSKIYQLDFNSDATNGILTTGGNIKVLVNAANLTGKDGAKADKFDNVTIGDDGFLYLQEDPGNVAYVAKHWVVNPLAGTQAQIEASAVQIFESDRSRFVVGGAAFQTIDEEHSGIVDITSIVADGITGSKWFLVATQSHTAATGANAATLVELGQFIALNYKVGTNSGLVGNLLTLDNGGAVVASGTAISHNITLTGTGGVFNTTSSTSVSGAIGGIGGLWKNGTGTLTLAGVNTYTGNTNIEAGKLVVNGSLSSTIRILKGGSFGGNATITGNLLNLGTLAPGNSPGTVNITGNYTEAGTLDIEVWGLTPGTQHDQVVVTGGSATFVAGSNLKVTRTGSTFDLTRTQSVLAVSAPTYSGAFTTLDRSDQTTQVFFNNATGRIHGSGLTETQTFANLTTDTNRQAIATALYADGLTNATVLRANAGGSATAKAFITTGEMGAATVAFLGAANVDTALDALSPEPYGTTQVMASRSASALARSFAGAMATDSGWNVRLGYEQLQATSTASPTSLNGSYDVDAKFALLSHQAGANGVFSVLIADQRGNTRASGFESHASGQSYGLGFGATFGFGRLDLSVVQGEFEAHGSRNGQSFVNQRTNATSLSARVTLGQLGGVAPYIGLTRNIVQSDAFGETGTGANLNVNASRQAEVLAEVGFGYSYALGDAAAFSLNIAYEHAFSKDGGDLTASFADATAPTSFKVSGYGAGQDLVRAGLGFTLALGTGRSATIGYDYVSGIDVESAHQLRANYTFRF